MQGTFISFEGVDGVGKTTQVERLRAYVESQGRECVVTREPGGTALGVATVLEGAVRKQGERVRLTEGPFAGIEGIYQMADGERRAIVLIELLSKQVRVRVAPANLRKVG